MIPVRDLKAEVERLIGETLREGSAVGNAMLARATGCLPIYSDMGGELVISPNLDVLEYQVDDDILLSVADERVRSIVLVRAARRYPTLAALEPPRPKDAVVCSACHGTGEIVPRAWCAVCRSLGWLTR